MQPFRFQNWNWTNRAEIAAGIIRGLTSWEQNLAPALRLKMPIAARSNQTTRGQYHSNTASLDALQDDTLDVIVPMHRDPEPQPKSALRLEAGLSDLELVKPAQSRGADVEILSQRRCCVVQ